MNGLALPLRLARRELRGGLAGFRVFIACLALGVGAIAAIGSLSKAVETGLKEDARVLLGGDVELRMVHRPAPAPALAYLAANADLSATAEMRAMARLAAAGPGGRRILVELKAVDGAYPLYGALEFAPARDIRAALAARGALWGAAVDEGVLARLGVVQGDVLRIGEADFEIRATIRREPDRGARAFTLGPRVMISAPALAATGLVRPGSLVYHHYRVRLAPEIDTGDWIANLREAFPEAAWRLRDFSGAAPGLRRFLDRITLYLTLVGLTALLVGGVGVAGAVKNYLDGRRDTIATLKCLGAPASVIFRTYFAQIFALAAAGIAVGVLLGALAPVGFARLLHDRLPVVARLDLYAGPLLLAVVFGLLTALVFSLWPLARARDLPAASLFRDLVAPARGRVRPLHLAVMGAALAALAGLAVFSAADRWIALWFVVGAAASFLAFRAAAWLLARAAAAAGRMIAGRAGARGGGRPGVGRPGLRLALANLHRPGAPTSSVVLSLGLGLTVLVAIALIHGNLTRQVAERMPRAAPTYFFIDIQPHQVAAFDAALSAIPGVSDIRHLPSLRGRITRVAGVPVARAKYAPHVAWAVRNERGLTYAATPPEGARIVAGDWWPADYAGPPLISFDAHIAEGMGIGVGDKLTINILGRDVEATIANLRVIDWTTLGMNFTVIFAPGTLEAAPHTRIATARATPEAELPAFRAVTRSFANVSAVRVKDALESVGRLLGQIAAAVRVTAAITLLAGTLVLAGAVAAGHRRRVYDAVVLKVLGATRRRVLSAYLLEFGILGMATAAIAAALGTGAAWFVVVRVMRAPWVFLPEIVAATVVACTLATLLMGFWGTWRALGQKAAPLLRND